MFLHAAVRQRTLEKALTVIIAVNVILLAGTWFVNAIPFNRQSILYMILRETDLASENVFAAWYSSMLLSLSAVMSILCFLMDVQRLHNKLLSYGWLIYAAAFLLLSFDELGSVHEYIGNIAVFEKAGKLVDKTGNSGWTFFYVVVGMMSIFMLLFSLLRLRKVKWALPLLLIALLLYLSNPFQEFFEIESMRAAGDKAWQRPVHLLLFEEGSELFGSLFFLMSIIFYAKQPSGEIVYTANISHGILFKATLALLMAFLMGFVLIRMLFGDVLADVQRGVPKNWITAFTTFLVFLYCVLYNKGSKRLMVFGIFSLCLSVYFGSNRFAFHFDTDYSPPRILLRSVISLFALIAYALVYGYFQTRMAKLLSMLSLLMVVAGIFATRLYSAEITFVGFGCFVLAVASLQIPLIRSG